MDINTILTNTLTTIGVALIGLGSSYLIYFIKKASDRVKMETSAIQNKETRKLVDNALDKTLDVINKNVSSASETIVKELKATTLDGKLTKEDGIAILGVVKGKVLTQLSEDVKGLVATEIGDVEGYVEILIENSLKDLKSMTPVVPITVVDETIAIPVVQ